MAIERDLLAPGTVTGSGRWAVGDVDGELFAVSRRCRHQFGDLSHGTIDEAGCLVCPWHQASYDVSTGEMVTGPRGFLGYHGSTPGYSALVKAVAKVLRLKVGKAVVKGGSIVVE